MILIVFYFLIGLVFSLWASLSRHKKLNETLREDNNELKLLLIEVLTAEKLARENEKKIIIIDEILEDKIRQN